MTDYSDKAKRDYNSRHPDVIFAGRILDMTSADDYRLFCEALCGAGIQILSDGWTYTARAHGDKHEAILKDAAEAIGWWEVRALGNGIRFSEGQSRGGMGVRASATRVQCVAALKGVV